MKCSIPDPRARRCKEGNNCYRCGFEIGEINRRKTIPLTPATVAVPFTDFETEETMTLDYDVLQKVIHK